ncbi:MAG: hypothetical protein KJ864_05135, partial [Candidatus Omnitrophica bacterium]|nr:hypothetical protein [Candidatus Omnitrophota bacterium]
IELKNGYDVALGENTMATVEWDVILTKTKNKKATDCFIFGEELVESQKWDDARMFYTKEILKYLSPVDVLQALHKLYPKGGRKSEKEHIWGGDIFVILEDFEEKDAPVLGPWAKSSEPRVNEHSISEEEAVSGKSSEYFNVEYAGGRNDYWAKTVDIPLNNPDLSLGIRVFIKSNGSFKGDLRVNTTYPPSGRCGITSSTYRKNLENGWIEYGLENLYEKARENGLQHKWSVDNMKIDKVLIDTSCAFCKFYVDDIQLYIVE